MIKIIEFIGTLNDGGAETLLKDYVRLIDREKFKITIVAIRNIGKTANAKIIEEAGVQIIYIYKHWNVFIRILNKVIGKRYIAYKLRKIIKRNHVKVLHAHLALLHIVKCVGKELGKLRLFYTCHNLVEIMFGKEREEEKVAADWLIENYGLKMIALHSEMAKELNELFKVNNSVVIRNAIDFARFKNVTITKEEKRNQIGINKDAYVIGHVGRFSDQKNHNFLLEVFTEIAKIKGNAHLLLVGSGDRIAVEEKIRDFGIEEKCTILTRRTDVNEIMKAMDVFVFPSKFEGLGIALIEAQVSGLKSYASDVIPIEAFKSENAIALPLGDAKMWAEVICKDDMIGNPNGSLEDYDMNKEIKRLEALYAGEK